MICSMCKKNQASIFSSKITPDGKREMEGLCINCAKKLGINTDEILKAQNQTIINNQSEQMNKQLEGLFKNLSENLGSIDGIELGAIPVNEEDEEQYDEEYEWTEDNPEEPNEEQMKRIEEREKNPVQPDSDPQQQEYTQQEKQQDTDDEEILK